MDITFACLLLVATFFFMFPGIDMSCRLSEVKPIQIDVKAFTLVYDDMMFSLTTFLNFLISGRQICYDILSKIIWSGLSQIKVYL